MTVWWDKAGGRDWLGSKGPKMSATKHCMPEICLCLFVLAVSGLFRDDWRSSEAGSLALWQL